MSQGEHKKIGLDAFLASNDGPESIVIRTLSSPNKTVSTVSQESSPKSLSSELNQAENNFHNESTPIREFERKEGNKKLRVNIRSKQQVYTFCVPVSNVLQREREMREASKRARVPEAQWSCSRLYSLWKRARNEDDDNIVVRSASSQLIVDLEPEETMREYSKFVWEPWLTTCLKGFYETGSIEIPDRCQGPDLLITLEYLKIITVSPNAFAFASKEPYDRIRAWSAYFTKRRTILDWLIKDYDSRGLAIRTYTTTTDSREGSSNVVLQVKGGDVDIFGRNKNDSRLLFKVVHSLFCENDSSQALTKDVPKRIRHDFRDQLLRFLPPKTRISFELHRVTVMRSGRSSKEVRPVLRIEGAIPIFEKPRQQLPLAGHSSHQREEYGRGGSVVKNYPTKYQSEVDAKVSTVFSTDSSKSNTPTKLQPVISAREIANTASEVIQGRYQTEAKVSARVSTAVAAKEPSAERPRAHVILSKEAAHVILSKEAVHEEKKIDKLNIPSPPQGPSPMSMVQMEKQGSITSGLSQSNMLDESTMGTIQKHASASESSQRQQASTARSSLSSKQRKSAVQRPNRAYHRKYEDYDDDTKTFTDSTISTTTYENRRPRRIEEPLDAFESFLFHVCDQGVVLCDQMLPAGTLMHPCDRIGRDSEIDNGNTALVTYVPDNEHYGYRRNNGASSTNGGAIAANSQDMTKVENVASTAKAVGDIISRSIDDFAFRVLDPENAAIQIAKKGDDSNTRYNTASY